MFGMEWDRDHGMLLRRWQAPRRAGQSGIMVSRPVFDSGCAIGYYGPTPREPVE
ncbi:MAG TPA: hypothetical protein VGK41_05565 [Solirubrobacterales bacterium]